MAGVKGRSGGARANVQKPRRVGSVRYLREQRKARRKLALAPESPPVTREPVGAPSDLPVNQAAVWASLAPHATAAGTLTPATALAFSDLCDLIVLRRATLSRLSRDGLMLADVAHPLMSRYVALQARVETMQARFRLAPMGKEIPQEEKPADEFAEFDAGFSVIQGGKA